MDLTCLFPAEYSLEDSDLEGLSDITVSSVHTSDLSSFEEDSDEEQPLSESSEEGELPSDGQSLRIFLLVFNFISYHKRPKNKKSSLSKTKRSQFLPYDYQSTE